MKECPDQDPDGTTTGKEKFLRRVLFPEVQWGLAKEGEHADINEGISLTRETEVYSYTSFFCTLVFIHMY